MSTLTVFLSSGKSLGSWQNDGILSREILLYQKLLEEDLVSRVQFFSYDAADKQFIASRAELQPFYRRIDVLTPGSGRRGGAWGISGVWAHRRTLRGSAVFKTNQVSGAWAALLASWLTGIPLVFRMGYLLSRRFALNGQPIKAWAARRVESLLARRASKLVVTSQEVAAHFQASRRFADKVALLPTYVDTSVFVANPAQDFSAPAITVARLRPQKNLAEMIRGCAKAQCDLVIVGKGELEESLQALSASLGASVTFISQLDNVELAKKLQEHTLFLLTSLHEGLPKVLIEAMACGMTVIGSPISGVTDLIRDGETGYLTSGFDGDAIAAAIERARTNADPEIGARARRLIEERFGLTGYARAEAAIYRQIAP